MKFAVALAAVVGAVGLSVPAAQACTPLRAVEPNGDSYSMNSSRGWAREQAEWRTQSDSVFIAQVSSLRLSSEYGETFTFTPIAALYDTALPTAAPTLKRHRGNTCNRPLAVADYVVVYADRSEASWTVVAIAPLSQLQDRPPEAPTERALYRGEYPLPDYPD